MNTRFRAFLALAVTGWCLALRLHCFVWVRPRPWNWLYAGLLPTWAVVLINTAFYACLVWLAIVFARSAIRKQEKILWVTFIANVVLAPARVLFTKIAATFAVLQTVLIVTSFMAALALLVSFWDEPSSIEPPQP